MMNHSTTKMNKENSLLLDYYYGDDADERDGD